MNCLVEATNYLDSDEEDAALWIMLNRMATATRHEPLCKLAVAVLKSINREPMEAIAPLRQWFMESTQLIDSSKVHVYVKSKTQDGEWLSFDDLLQFILDVDGNERALFTWFAKNKPKSDQTHDDTAASTTSMVLRPPPSPPATMIEDVSGASSLMSDHDKIDGLRPSVEKRRNPTRTANSLGPSALTADEEVYKDFFLLLEGRDESFEMKRTQWFDSHLERVSNRKLDGTDKPGSDAEKVKAHEREIQAVRVNQCLVRIVQDLINASRHYLRGDSALVHVLETMLAERDLVPPSAVTKLFGEAQNRNLVEFLTPDAKWFAGMCVLENWDQDLVALKIEQVHDEGSQEETFAEQQSNFAWLESYVLQCASASRPSPTSPDSDCFEHLAMRTFKKCVQRAYLKKAYDYGELILDLMEENRRAEDVILGEWIASEREAIKKRAEAHKVDVVIEEYDVRSNYVVNHPGEALQIVYTHCAKEQRLHAFGKYWLDLFALGLARNSASICRDCAMFISKLPSPNPLQDDTDALVCALLRSHPEWFDFKIAHEVNPTKATEWGVAHIIWSSQTKNAIGMEFWNAIDKIEFSFASLQSEAQGLSLARSLLSLGSVRLAVQVVGEGLHDDLGDASTWIQRRIEVSKFVVRKEAISIDYVFNMLMEPVICESLLFRVPDMELRDFLIAQREEMLLEWTKPRWGEKERPIDRNSIKSLWSFLLPNLLTTTDKTRNSYRTYLNNIASFLDTDRTGDLAEYMGTDGLWMFLSEKCGRLGSRDFSTWDRDLVEDLMPGKRGRVYFENDLDFFPKRVTSLFAIGMDHYYSNRYVESKEMFEKIQDVMEKEKLRIENLNVDNQMEEEVIDSTDDVDREMSSETPKRANLSIDNPEASHAGCLVRYQLVRAEDDDDISGDVEPVPFNKAILVREYDGFCDLVHIDKTEKADLILRRVPSRCVEMIDDEYGSSWCDLFVPQKPFLEFEIDVEERLIGCLYQLAMGRNIPLSATGCAGSTSVTTTTLNASAVVSLPLIPEQLESYYQALLAKLWETAQVAKSQRNAREWMFFNLFDRLLTSKPVSKWEREKKIAKERALAAIQELKDECEKPIKDDGGGTSSPMVVVKRARTELSEDVRWALAETLHRSCLDDSMPREEQQRRLKEALYYKKTHMRSAILSQKLAGTTEDSYDETMNYFFKWGPCNSTWWAYDEIENDVNNFNDVKKQAIRGKLEALKARGGNLYPSLVPVFTQVKKSKQLESIVFDFCKQEILPTADLWTMCDLFIRFEETNYPKKDSARMACERKLIELGRIEMGATSFPQVLERCIAKWPEFERRLKVTRSKLIMKPTPVAVEGGEDVTGMAAAAAAVAVPKRMASSGIVMTSSSVDAVTDNEYLM